MLLPKGFSSFFLGGIELLLTLFVALLFLVVVFGFSKIVVLISKYYKWLNTSAKCFYFFSVITS